MENLKPHVAHVTSWLSRAGGGIPPVLWALAQETARRGFRCSVFGLRDQWTETDCPNHELPTIAGNVVGPNALGFSPALPRKLREQIPTRGIVHTHGLWMYPGLAARQCARRTGSSLVISPHGMLEPWALNNSRWKKQVAAQLFENKNLRTADCLHALCLAEAENFRRYGLKNPIAVIPNGVALDQLVAGCRAATPPLAGGRAANVNLPDANARQSILFLSRLHPKKGLENLLQAWAQIAGDFKEWRLVIAGSGDPAYELKLKSQAASLGMERSIHFSGPLYGEKKKQALASAGIFVLPSFSEGFSMAVLEAAAAGLPVVLTPECNFPELAKAGAAIETSPDAPAIGIALRQLLELSDERRKAMGQRGADLISKSYTWPAIAAQMCGVYHWLLGSGSKPECVI